jgi:Tol biopolymer transport system component/tRNA A-37 threonylcarbamoyl transferase component Bud32
MENQKAFAEQLFGEALELPREERAAFLAGACRDTPAIRQLVQALLEENDRLSGFLSDPPYKKAGEFASPVLAPGTRLGRYAIVDQLGAGGMGVVYRARDEKLEREVAIKMVARGVLASEEARRHFRKEALALAKLNHAHIAAVYDVGEQDGADFLVMELVQGQSLAAKLRAGRLPVSDATAIARQVAEALGEAHEHGVIHRDLKPANVMITPKGDAKVLDFGLAKLLASGADATMSVAETRGLLGTPVYMSPEQALGKGVDARTDLWSLGVLYYELLAGRPPFSGNNSLDVLHAITGAPLPSIRAIRPELPLLAEHIVSRALEKDCDLRYQRAAEMETDLKRLTRDLNPMLASVSSVSLSGIDASEKVRRDRPRVAMFAGAAGLVLLLAVAYVLRPTVPPPRVIGIKQVTHDGQRKLLIEGYRVQNTMATDGLRVYFPVLGTPSMLQVSTDGGESVPVTIPFELDALLGLSFSRSEMLLLGPPADTAVTEEGGLWTMPVLGGQARRIGNITAFDATWSRDGASIYYSKGRDIWVANGDGSGARKILTIAIDGVPNWMRFSPDGRLFRFGVRDNKFNSNSLWEARADGSGMRRLLSGDAWPNECCGAWTPDGKYFVFESMRGGSWNLWAMREKRDWWRKTNPEPVQLTTGEMVAQSALPSVDGKSTFFVGITRRSELVRFDAQKRSFVSYLPGISVEEVAFSSDGSRIAYASLPERNLWVCKPDGSDRRELTFAPLHIGAPRWSPDGKQIAFSAHEPGKTSSKTYVIPAEGGNPEQLTQGIPSEGNEDEIDPSWSPNGEELTFGSSFSTASSSRQHSIQILNLKSRVLTALPDSGGYFSPRWSPDGRWMVAIDGHSGTLELYDFNTQKWEELTKVQAAYPSWSMDSQCIYFNSGLNSENNLFEYRLCLRDRKAQVVADLAQVGRTMSELGGWSGITLDGSILAVRDISLEEIYSAELDLP